MPSVSSYEKGLLERLKPYLAIVHAVRAGDHEIFKQACIKHKEDFAVDSTLSLIQRLSQSVLKTALRNLSLSYSKIPFTEVQRKLGLGSEASAEYVCAKSIGDAVIEAVLTHGDKDRYMQSVAVANVYATQEPLDALNQRIQFCLDIRNEAIRSMRYPNSKQDMPEYVEVS